MSCGIDTGSRGVRRLQPPLCVGLRTRRSSHFGHAPHGEMHVVDRLDWIDPREPGSPFDRGRVLPNGRSRGRESAPVDLLSALVPKRSRSLLALILVASRWCRRPAACSRRSGTSPKGDPLRESRDATPRDRLPLVRRDRALARPTRDEGTGHHLRRVRCQLGARRAASVSVVRLRGPPLHAAAPLGAGPRQPADAGRSRGRVGVQLVWRPQRDVGRAADRIWRRLKPPTSERRRRCPSVQPRPLTRPRRVARAWPPAAVSASVRARSRSGRARAAFRRSGRAPRRFERLEGPRRRRRR